MTTASEAWEFVDLPAEADIIALLLRGEVRPKGLQPLAAKHYFSGLHAAVHAAAVSLGRRGAAPNVDAIARQLVVDGMQGVCAADLREIADAAPLLTAAEVTTRARRLVELSRCRQIIAVIQQAELALKTGQLTSAKASARLAVQMGGIA